MRKLPVYFLIDASDSMLGEPIKAVENGLDDITRQLRGDPYALETAWLSVIAFAGRAKQLAPMRELMDFRPPAIPIGSGTNLGAGLDLLMDCMDREVHPTTREKKGDWKAIIFLFTDGAPTENPAKAVERWNRDYKKKATLVAVTFDNGGDVQLLEKFADTVLNLTETSPEAFHEFFRWVSASLQATSMAVGEQASDEARLAGRGIYLEKARPVPPRDERFANLPVRCSSSGKLWLAKYAAESGAWPWRLVDSYPVDEDGWQELSGQAQTDGVIDLADVNEVPSCPICHAPTLVHCGVCGNLSCLLSDGGGQCPWCKTKYAGTHQVDHLDVGRSRG